MNARKAAALVAIVVAAVICTRVLTARANTPTPSIKCPSAKVADVTNVTVTKGSMCPVARTVVGTIMSAWHKHTSSYPFTVRVDGKWRTAFSRTGLFYLTATATRGGQRIAWQIGSPVRLVYKP